MKALILAVAIAPSLAGAQAVVPGAAADRRLEWRLERTWQVGGSDDDALLLTMFFQKDLATDRRGRLYVIDRTEHQVVAYDSAGRRVHSYGREGSGPGELRFPIWVDVREDGRLLVGDAGKNAVVVFTTDGRVEPELPFDRRLRGVRAMNGALLGLTSRTRDSLALVAVSDAQATTILQMPVARPKSTPPVCRLTDYPVSPIFGPTLLWAARGKRVVAATGDFRLHVFHGTAAERILTRSTPVRSSSRALAQRHVGPGIPIEIADLPPCMVPAEMILDVAEIAPALPAYSALTLAPDDRVWATRYVVRGEPGVVDVYHVERGYEGTLLVGEVRPAGFLSTGLLISLEHDQDDVPMIVAYRVVRN